MERWPREGLDVPADEQDAVSAQLLETHSCLPVFIDDDVADRHYNGFSNRCAHTGACACGDSARGVLTLPRARPNLCTTATRPR